MTIYLHWCLRCMLALLVGCASSTWPSAQTPRITEVTRTTRLKGYAPGEQGEEFYVVWAGAEVGLVKFEYRQVNAPNEVFSKSYVPTTRHFHVFTVAGEEFQKGGRVSAWRVSLWNQGQMLTELKSALW